MGLDGVVTMLPQDFNVNYEKIKKLMEDHFLNHDKH